MTDSPLRYAQVLDEYNQWRDKNPDQSLSLPEFALNQDTLEGNNYSRRSAYNDNALKHINATIDKLFSPLGAVTAPTGRQIGEQAGKFFGQEDFAQIGEDVFRDLPRMMVEMSPWTVAAKIPRAISLGTKALGMASSALSTYTATDSPAAAAVTAATLPLAPRFGAAGEKVAQNLMLRGTKKAISEAGSQALKTWPKLSAVGAKLGEEAGREAGFLAHGVLQQEATSLATGQGLANPLDPQELFANILSNVAFAPLSIRELMRKPIVTTRTGVEINVPSQTHWRQANMIADHQRPIADRILAAQVEAENARVRQVQEGEWTEDQARVADVTAKYDLAYEMYGQALGPDGRLVREVPNAPKATNIVNSPASVTMDPEFHFTMRDSRTDQQRAQDRWLGREPPEYYTDRTGLELPDRVWQQDRARSRKVFVEEANLEGKGRVNSLDELVRIGKLPPDNVQHGLSVGLRNLKDVIATLHATLPPDVRREYIRRGFLPDVNEAWVRKEFQSQLDDSLTGSFEEAYNSFETALQNRHDRLLDDAKRAAIQAAEVRSPTTADGIQRDFFTALEGAPESLKSSVGRAWQLALGEVGRNQAVDHSNGLAKRLLPLLKAGNFNAAESLVQRFIKSDFDGRTRMVGGTKQQGTRKVEQSFDRLTQTVEKGGDQPEVISKADVSEDVEKGVSMPLTRGDSARRTVTDALSLLDEAQLGSVFEQHFGTARFKGRKMEDFRDLLIAFVTDQSDVKKQVASKWVKKVKGQYVDVDPSSLSETEAAKALRNVFGNYPDTKFREVMTDVVKRAVESGKVTSADAKRLLWDAGKGDGRVQTGSIETLSPEMEMASLKMIYSDRLQDLGWEKPVADEMSTFMVRVAQTLDVPGKGVSYRQLEAPTAEGVATDYGVPGRWKSATDTVFKMIGLDLESTAARPAQGMITLVHEQFHLIERLADRVAKGQTVKGRAKAVVEAYESMKRYADGLTPEQRQHVLQTMYELITPEARTADIQNIDLGYLSQNAQEFMSEYTGILAAGVASNPKTRIKMFQDLKWLPIEERQYALGMIRNLSDAINPIRQSMLNAKRPIVIGFENFHNDVKGLLKNAKVVDAAVMQLTDMMARLDPQAVAAVAYDPKRALYFSEGELPEGYELLDISAKRKAQGRAQEAVDVATEFTFGDALEGGQKPNLWERWFSPYSLFAKSMQKMGLQIVEDSRVLLFDTQPGFARATKQLMAPILIRGQLGKLNFDEGSPLLSFAADPNTERRLAQRTAASRIFNKMQEFQAGFEDPRIQAEVATQMKGLSDTERANTLVGMRQMLEISRNGAALILRSKQNDMALAAARLMQFKSPEVDHKQLVKIAESLVGAVEDPAQFQAVQQQLLQSGVHPDALTAAINHIADVQPLIVKLRQAFAERGSWFMSEQRPGTWIVETVDADGKNYYTGADSERHAEVIAAEQAKKGRKLIQAYDKYERLGAYAGAMPHKLADRFMKLEQSAWAASLKRIRETQGDQIADALTAQFDPIRAVKKDIASVGIGKLFQKRYLAGGREELDYVRVMLDYTVQTASSVSRRDVRQRMELLLNDRQLQGHDSVMNSIRKQMDTVLAPNSQEWHAAKSMLSSYFLGANISSAMIEMTQNGVTLVPRLIEHGHGFIESYKMLGRAIPETFKLTRSKDELNRLVERGRKQSVSGQPLGKAEERAIYFQKALDESVLDWGHLEDTNLGKDTNEIMHQRFGHGKFDEVTPAKLARNVAYGASQQFLHLYSRMANTNTKIAFLAGLDSGQRKGLTGEALYQHAREVLANSQFGGGRAARPLYIARLSTDASRSTFGLVHTLQQYSMGMTSMVGQLGRDALGRNKFLKPHERKQAQKAFGTMMLTMTALSGALGVPGVGAALTLLEKIFGVEAHKAVREGLAALGGDDEETGNMISDVALNGVANHFFGIDMASRTGINSIAGFSTFNGFNVVDLLGPAPSIVKNIFDATSAVAKEGDYMNAVKTLIPQTFKNSVDLATNYHKYGDMRFMDRGNNLIMKPTEWEAMAYMVGFRPKKLKDWRTAQQMMKVSDEMAAMTQAGDLDGQARQLLRNPNPGVVLQYIQQRQQQDPLANPNDMLRSIVDRAVAMTMQRDLLDGGLRSNVQEREKIAGMFGDTIRRKSEVETLQLKQELLQKLGFPYGTQPATFKDRLKAQLMDQLTAQGMSRPRAVAEIQKLL